MIIISFNNTMMMMKPTKMKWNQINWLNRSHYIIVFGNLLFNHHFILAGCLLVWFYFPLHSLRWWWWWWQWTFLWGETFIFFSIHPQPPSSQLFVGVYQTNKQPHTHTEISFFKFKSYNITKYTHIYYEKGCVWC